MKNGVGGPSCGGWLKGILSCVVPRRGQGFDHPPEVLRQPAPRQHLSLNQFQRPSPFRFTMTE